MVFTFRYPDEREIV